MGDNDIVRKYNELKRSPYLKDVMLLQTTDPHHYINNPVIEVFAAKSVEDLRGYLPSYWSELNDEIYEDNDKHRYTDQEIAGIINSIESAGDWNTIIDYMEDIPFFLEIVIDYVLKGDIPQFMGHKEGRETMASTDSLKI